MNTYKATVRVAKSGGLGTMVIWAQVQAANPYAARCQFEALYGQGNVVSVPVIVR